jgi:ABC-type multidrug transport system fused ATPase/permease subunit
MGQSLLIGRRICIRLRSIVIAEVFLKALRRRDLSGDVKGGEKGLDGKDTSEGSGASDGKVNNLVAVDAFAISEISGYFFYFFSCPFAIIVNTVLLYNTLGLAAFAGIAALILLVPVQTLVGRLVTVLQRRFMAASDARLETATEVIAHIKLIKFNAWESKFFERMAKSRAHELHVLALRFATIVLSNVVVWGTPVIVTASAFAVHTVVLKQPLAADTAFASLVLFNLLRDPMALLQDVLTRAIQAYTSCGRLQAYLSEPDTLKYSQTSRPGPNDPQIGFKGAIIAYNAPGGRIDHDEFSLGELDLSFPVGKLSMIVGPVGSGKTTLILSLLGETTLLKGQVFMPDDHASKDLCEVDPATGLADTAAFCAQTPWLVGASIKENIVFGCRWDKSRYGAVVHACSLRRDFEIFELGDDTEVGEKGTTCSGGQKARISLARALYSSARTIILDDVLSAVDAQTARHIYINCLQGSLVEGRTIILVTHAVSLVAPAADYVVMLDSGRVSAQGTPSDLIAAGKLEVAEEETGSSSSTLAPNSPHDIIEENLDGDKTEALEAQKQVDRDHAVPELDKVDKRLVQKESSGEGMISLRTYLLYLRSMGSFPYWVLLATAFFCTQLLQVLNNAWIKDWANSSDRRTSVLRFYESDKEEEKSTLFYLGVYCALSGAYIIGVATRVGLGSFGSISASRALYDQMLKRLLGAKMR